MSPILIAALTAFLQSAIPAVLKWLSDRWLRDFTAFLRSQPELMARFDAIRAQARGEVDGAAVGAAPDAFKELLREALDQFGQSIKRPLVRSVYSTISAFVVNQLADVLWDKMFGPKGIEPNGQPALAGDHPTDVAAFQSALLGAVKHHGATAEKLFPPDPAPKPGPKLVTATAPETPETPPEAPAAPSAPESVTATAADVPPVSPAAPPPEL